MIVKPAIGFLTANSDAGYWPHVAKYDIQTTAARNIFSGLTPGQVYFVQLNAVGSAGPSDWSDDGETMVM